MFDKRKRREALLATYTGHEATRVRAAIVALADGDETKLEGLLAQARMDYRDILMADEYRRRGEAPPRLSPEEVRALEERFRRPEPPPSTAAGPRVDLVLVDAGSRSPELMKAIRAATGLGLAEVAALVEQAPVPILTGVSQETVERLRAEIAAAGGAAEAR